MPIEWIKPVLVLFLVVGIIFLTQVAIKKFHFFDELRDANLANKHFNSIHWGPLRTEFEQMHQELGADRINRAFNVYHRIMWIAYNGNIFRSKNDPRVHRIAPFDKDVDTFWRFHASKPDYDAWCMNVFGGHLRPRNDTYEDPHWETREERLRTKIAYKKHFKLQEIDANQNDDFIPPNVVV